MKKAILLFIVALMIAPVASAIDRMPAEVKPAGVTVVIPRQAIDNAPALEVFTIIHHARPDKPGKPGKGPKGETCYGFISGKAKLIETENVLINPTNSGMTEEDVLNTIQVSASTWDNETSTQIFGDFTKDYTADFDTYADGRNEVSFGNYPQNGVIAVTRIWGYFSGKPNSRYISQFDIMFDTDFAWGDAEIDATLMDLQNIATHELGHTTGLNDTYSDSCKEVTMYGYSAYGETKKRTLETPDISGLQILYGI